MVRHGSHENISRTNDVKMGSERSFGFIFTAVFAAFGGWQLYLGDTVWAWAPLAGAGVLAIIALALPRLLRPLNIVWLKFGLLLHKIVSPLALGLVFFVTVTPTALIFKLLGKDPLSLGLEPKANSYWIHRDPPGPDPQSMSNQF